MSFENQYHFENISAMKALIFMKFETKAHMIVMNDQDLIFCSSTLGKAPPKKMSQWVGKVQRGGGISLENQKVFYSNCRLVVHIDALEADNLFCVFRASSMESCRTFLILELRLEDFRCKGWPRKIPSPSPYKRGTPPLDVFDTFPNFHQWWRKRKSEKKKQWKKRKEKNIHLLSTDGGRSDCGPTRQ